MVIVLFLYYSAELANGMHPEKMDSIIALLEKTS